MIDPAEWLRVSLRAESELQSDLAADALVAAGGAAVRQDGLRLTTHIPLMGPPESALRMVREALALAGIRPGPRALDWAVEADRDWAAEWKSGLRPRRIGRRIVVHPTWIDPPAGPRDVCIAIDPGMAFGTAEHATTRGALRLLEAAIRPGARVLDAGTGSGILAIAALRLGAAAAVAVDADPEAVSSARANLAANGVDASAECVEAEVDSGWLARRARPFDLILANILSGVLVPLLPAFARALAPGGALIVSGILADEAAAFDAQALSAGWAMRAEDVEDGWWSALFSRRARAGYSSPG